MESIGRGKLLKKQQKHIVLIVENLSVPFDRRVWREAKSLFNSGYRVSVISPKGLNTDTSSHEILEGIELFRYNLPLSQNSKLDYIFEYATAFLITLLKLIKIMLKNRIHAIHIANPPDIFFPLGWMGKVAGWKFIFDQHDLAPETYQYKFGSSTSSWILRILKQIEKLTYGTADHVIATNESIKNIALGRGKKYSRDVTVVRNGPDKSFQPVEQNYYLKKGKSYLAAYIGVMGKQDGVEYILHAADILINKKKIRSIHFILIGYGDEYEKLSMLKKDLNLDEFIEMPGRLPDNEVLSILSTADVCLAPDPRNGLNEFHTMNKIMDYMRCGKPIVSFDLDETRFTAGDAALYVNNNNADLFGNAIIYLIENKEKREEMGAHGKNRVNMMLTWERSELNLIKVYDRLFRIIR